jgi:ornithine cyclodeaminase/alanine dehydrogenase-like protein (mu-crystallin family)
LGFRSCPLVQSAVALPNASRLQRVVADQINRSQVCKFSVFSPFGLSILDLAVSSLVCELAEQQKVGTVIESFLPESWI